MRKARGKNPGKWLLICFPYGLYLMWKRECGWHRALKMLITAAVVCAAAAVLILPAPDKRSNTEVKLVGAEPNAQVFGPDAPAGYNPSEYIVAEGGLDLLAPEYVDDTIYVYASVEKGSTYYHNSRCRYAYASAPRVSLYEAHTLGFVTPCGLCNPPLYDPITDTVSDNPGAVVTPAPQY